MDSAERKAIITKTFNTIATGYDRPALRFFPLSAEYLAKYLSPSPNAHILDVATGTGTVALALAKHVPNGHVTGVDLSEGMLAQAMIKADQQGISNTTFLQMDMLQLTFPDNHFDSASCGFGIFFLDDMLAGLHQIKQKVKPGGNIIICSFCEDAFLPLVEIFFSRIEKFGIERPPQRWQRISTEPGIVQLYEEAEFNHIQVHKEDVGYYLENAEQWWELLWNAGYRGLIDQLPPDDIEIFRCQHLAEIKQLTTDKGIWLDIKVLYCVGEKPKQ